MARIKISKGNSDKTGVNIGFWSLLTLIFVTLKLTSHIDWNWFFVLLPVLMPFVIFFGAFFLYCGLEFLESILNRRRWK